MKPTALFFVGLFTTIAGLGMAVYSILQAATDGKGPDEAWAIGGVIFGTLGLFMMADALQSRNAGRGGRR